MAWFKTGTINLTNNSDIVIGNSTNFDSSIQRGDILVVDGRNYEIDGVVNSIQLKLASPFSGGTGNGVNYGIIHTQATVAGLDKDVNTMIELAAEIIENGVEGGDDAYEIAVKNGFVGTEAQWLASLHGTDGTDGIDGTLNVPALLNFSEHAGQSAGGSGISVLVPISTNAPPLTLTQSAMVIIPKDTPRAGIGMWAQPLLNGTAVYFGLTDAPLPPPPGSDEELDLSGSGTIYGDPGSIFSLGIYLAGSTGNFNLTAPSGFPLRIERRNEISVPVASQWTITNQGSPWYPSGSAASGTNGLAKRIYSGTGGTTVDNSEMVNGRLKLMKHIYLSTEPLALDFKISTNEVITQTPSDIKLTWRGLVNLNDTYPYLAGMYEYMTGQFALKQHWNGNSVVCLVGRGAGSSLQIESDQDPAFARGTLKTIEAQYIDNVGGTGGVVRFFVDGVQIGADKPCEVKPRITPAMNLECNVVGNNTSNSEDGLEVAYVGVSFGKPEIQKSYDPVSSGTISAADLENLVVDARSFSSAQAPVTVSYAAAGQNPYNMEVVVSDMIVPAGRAFKAVLEDWSSGSGVPHPNELIMTKPTAQNCRFEDSVLYGAQASWTEVEPKGPVPNIGGINYYCNGIRMGTYVQLQFGYDWDTTQMPANPFGNPEGKNSYMVPHKWLIYDNAGTLLGRVEQPDGQPLNTAATPTMWSGALDGRGCPIITTANRYYPKGTVRSGIIWRSHAEPPAYTQQEIWNRVPTYDVAVPFASQTGFSVNGGDMRIGMGEQLNGFGNYRSMSWEPTTYNEIITQGQNTLNPYKQGYNQNDIVPNAGVWLKYTPFNQMARSPITGPGGVRDDRQIMPEMVAQYARDVTKKRPHDNRDMKQIALDYLTGYVSDPFHCFENGKLTPLFKGNMRRNITMRNHYYGGGEQSTPPERAYYAQGGRSYVWATTQNPLRVSVPFAGSSSDKPYFGTNMIDDAHAHQFPHWGSLLWQTPEFAMLGVKFWDQARLYTPWVLNSGFNQAHEFSQRSAAWKFFHAALAWKTASSNSSRLYSRADVMDYIGFDFEAFYDRFYASDPGFLNPPASMNTADPEEVYNVRAYVAAQYFGAVASDGWGVYQHDFQIGYWVSALHAAEKLGFNDALRAHSPKVKAVIDWLITSHQKRITNKINSQMRVNVFDNLDYNTPIWSNAQIVGASYNAANLPQTYDAISDLQGANKAPSWDTFTTTSGQVYNRDGQAFDQLLAGASLLVDMGRTDTGLLAARDKSLQLRQQKIDSETAKGFQEAGKTWFLFHQTTNNPPFKP
ncbi:hypothetical protein [Sphingobium sp. KCTC 72723]|uniref:hypothetical protein n=1 Tax=Sphingobium sp. KCTC 72723 TaxID=2733867 RepID=UPI00165E812B|nr:hypothetical protein [Sphingobium sp. KCTC 72723]